jgi:hypothetical protein
VPRNWFRGIELLDLWGITEIELKGCVKEGALTPHDENLEPHKLGPNGELWWDERFDNYRVTLKGWSATPSRERVSGGYISHRIDVLSSAYKGSEVEECEKRYSLARNNTLRASIQAPESSLVDEHDNYFMLRGSSWEVRFSGETKLLQDIMGVRIIARLLRCPGQEIHAADLVGNVQDDHADRLARLTDDQLSEDEGIQRSNLRIPDTDRFEAGRSPGTEAAWRGYLEVLGATVNKARESGDPLELEEAQDAFGSAFEKFEEFRNSKPKSNPEEDKARLNVKNNIARAMSKIKKDHPALAAHLRDHLRTGVRCSYNDRDTKWAISD